MAFTTNTFTLTTGFSPADIFVTLGEVLADMGVMTNATAWHDSFTDTSGSDVRIVAQVFTGDTRGTIYHAFFMKSSFDGLYYTAYYNWDVATHQSQGAPYYDHTGTYEHPDDFGSGSWLNFYTKIDSFADAGDITFTTFKDSGSWNWCRIVTAGDPRLIGFQKPSVGLKAGFSYNDVGPMSMWGVSDTNLAMTAVTRATILSGERVSSTGAYNWTSTSDLTGLLANGSRVTASLFSKNPASTSTDIGIGVYGMCLGGGYDGGTAYQVVHSYPFMPAVFDGMNTGELGFAVGFNSNSWTPAAGDTLVVSAGVEEYLVHDVKYFSANLYSYGANWVASVLRVV